MINLENVNIILTGATGIIGGSILDKLNEAGANIIATGTNQIKLDKIKIRQIDPEKYLNCGKTSSPPIDNIIIGSRINKDSINTTFLFLFLLNKQYKNNNRKIIRNFSVLKIIFTESLNFSKISLIMKLIFGPSISLVLIK